MSIVDRSEDAGGDGDRPAAPWRHPLLQVPGAGPEASRRALKQRVAAAARELAETVQLLDADAVGEDGLRSLAEHVEASLGHLAAAPSLRSIGSVTGSGSWQADLGERSPISGRSNPVAAPLQLWADGDVVRARGRFGFAYEGPEGAVHGGVVAAAFDEVVGVAQSLSGLAGMTGTLTVRMRRPTPLHEQIDFEGRVDRREGRKIFVSGSSSTGGELLCEAEAVMIVPRGGPRWTG